MLRLLRGACWSAGLLYCAVAAASAERVPVCFNYGCLAQAEVEFNDDQLNDVRRLMEGARSPGEEREALGLAVGRMLGWAGQQSPIAADRGGNFADDAVYGRMDCIDHSTTTTRLLRVLENHGWLHFHRVLRPALRARFLVFQHYSALIEEVEENDKTGSSGAPEGKAEHARFVVDSWFFDNGQPAVVMPLAAWMAGEGPNVDN